MRAVAAGEHHCHSDHIGGNAAVQAAFDCPISIPAAEADLVVPWDPDGLLLTYADHHAPSFAYDALIDAGATLEWGDLEWEALSAPGHDMGALMFFNRRHRLLISATLWWNGFGTWSRRRSIRSACLRPGLRWIYLDARCRRGDTGHGEPFAVAGALARPAACRRLRPTRRGWPAHAESDADVRPAHQAPDARDEFRTIANRSPFTAMSTGCSFAWSRLRWPGC
jgi:glyoxylase-like metal-dependent hydrolase (beta-lactamase superfamily II)